MLPQTVIPCRKRIACHAAVPFLLAMLAANGQTALPLIEANSISVWEQVNSLAATVSVWSAVRMGDKTEEMRASGAMSFLRDTGKEKFHQQMTLIDQKYSVIPSVHTLYDGEHLYEWIMTGFPGGQKQLEYDLTKAQFWPGGALLFRLLHEQFSVSVKADSTCGKRPVYVLEGTPKRPVPAVPWRNVFFSVDQALGLLVKVELCDVNGIPVSVMELSDFHLNGDVNKEQFTPPAGAKTHSVK